MKSHDRESNAHVPLQATHAADRLGAMRTLAKALIETAAFLEFSSDDSVNPDDAVRELEGIAHTLRSASPEEVAAIREALRDMTDASQTDAARSATRKFSEAFLESMGLPP